jgi:hypothetical protein
MAPAPSSRSGRGKPIGEILIENGAVSPEQLARAIAEQNSKYDLLGRILVRQGACGNAELLSALQAQYRVTAVEIGRVPIDPAAIGKVDKDVCEKGRLVPFDLIGNTLCIAMTNVLNRKAITDIEAAADCKVKAFSAPWLEIKKVITAYFEQGGKGIALVQKSDEALPVPTELPPVAEPPVQQTPKKPVTAPVAPPKVSKPKPAPEIPAQKAAIEEPAPAIDETTPSGTVVVPFSGISIPRKQQKKSAKHDTMRILKAQLMKDRGTAPEHVAPAKEDIVMPGQESAEPVPVEQPAAINPPPIEPSPITEEVPVAPPPEPVSALEPVAIEPPVKKPKSVGPAATVAYKPTPEWSKYPPPPADGLVPSKVAPPDVEPALVAKLREKGHRGSADHEVLDALPVAERFAPSLDDYKVTVSALNALDNVVVEEKPAAPPTPVEARKPVPPQLVTPSTTTRLNIPAMASGTKARTAIGVSQEEAKTLAPRGGEDREAGFRARFLSSRAVKVHSAS